jgi:MFS family permease
MKKTLQPNQIVTLLGIGTSISLLGESTLYTVLPNQHIAQQLGITIAMVGILLGTNRAMRLFTNGPVGILYEKMPRRPLLVLSLILGALSSILYTIGYGFWPLFAGRLSWGLAWSLLWIGCKTVVQEISNQDNRGHFNGRYNIFYFFGIGFASLLGAILTDMVGFSMGQRISAGMLLITAAVWYFVLPETKGVDGIHKAASSESEAEQRKTEAIPWKAIIPAAFVIFTSRFIERGLVAASTPLWMANLFGDGARFLGFLIPIATLTGLFNAAKVFPSILSAPASGKLSDRLGRRWPVVGWTLLFGAFGLAAMSSRLTWLAVIGGLMIPVLSASVETLVPAIVGDHTGKTNNGRALGIIFIFADLGSTLGPMIGLALLDASLFTIEQLYLLSAFLVLVAVSVSWFTSNQNRIAREPVK